MSILLKALKKSEAQRQMGQPPDIHSAIDEPIDENGSDRQWIPLSMLAVSAVAIAWFGWQQYREPALTSPAGVDQVAVVSGKEQGQEQDKLPEISPEPRTPVESFQAERKGLSAITILPPNSAQEANARKQELARSLSSYEAEDQPDSGGNEVPEGANQPQDQPVADPLATKMAEQSPPDPNSKEPKKRASRVEAHESEPISFWQVPQGLRDGLPEFRITVLVYAEAPEDRFVLINGLRLVEKQELASGVVLDEIRRDGAVFRYRNYRFLVKG